MEHGLLVTSVHSVRPEYLGQCKVLSYDLNEVYKGDGTRITQGIVVK
jgi:hypothetical protein